MNVAKGRKMLNQKVKGMNLASTDNGLLLSFQKIEKRRKLLCRPSIVNAFSARFITFYIPGT